MLHVRPSREIRTNYRNISELVKKGDRVIITVNGVGDGVFISMDDFNEYEKLRQTIPVMTSQERAELTKELKDSLEDSNTPGARFYPHAEVSEIIGMNQHTPAHMLKKNQGIMVDI